MRRNWTIRMMLIAVFTFVFASQAFAFQDLDGHKEKEQILALKEQGIINGVDEANFQPDGKLNYAQAIQLIAKGIKMQPGNSSEKADDSSASAPSSAWYASAFSALQAAGITIPKDINPSAEITREEFIHYAIEAMLLTGDYAFIDIYMLMEDEDLVTPEYMSNIQIALISSIAELKEDQTFGPQDILTRAEAAAYIHNIINWIDKQNTISPIYPEEEVEVIITKETDDVQKVTVSWGEQPHPGYGISIASISFNHETQEAIVYYNLHYPDPDMMYPQVIVTPTADTYVATDYKVKAERNWAQSVSSTPPSSGASDSSSSASN